MEHLGAIVARNVRAERARRGWSQQDLGDRLGWSRSNVGHLEGGRRAVRVEDLPDLCRALGISLIRLFDGAADHDWEALRLPPLRDWSDQQSRREG